MTAAARRSSDSASTVPPPRGPNSTLQQWSTRSAKPERSRRRLALPHEVTGVPVQAQPGRDVAPAPLGCRPRDGLEHSLHLQPPRKDADGVR